MPTKSLDIGATILAEKQIDASITVQVYNLKQNLTKQMLCDLLKPHVASIDFKTKSNNTSGNNENNSNQVDNDMVINEEYEDVFIKFESVDKRDQVFKLFNLNEGMQQHQSPHVNTMNDKNNNNQNEEKDSSSAKKNESPFLLRQMTIY